MDVGKRRTVIEKAIKGLIKEQKKNNGDVALCAKSIFGLEGIHPTYWGISKQQFQVFVDNALDKHSKGEIINEHGNDPDHAYYYPPNIFDDPKRGPNMHQVCAQLIQPQTKNFEVMLKVNKNESFIIDPMGTTPVNIPSLSYSVQQNIYSGGLLCEVFFSHAWEEPFFKAASSILEAWPEDCIGGYICSLCNPQNLDMGALRGGTVENSPFYRILMDPSSPPRELLMVGNSRQRLWCVLEAYVALCRRRVFRVKITGEAHHLLMSSDAEYIKTHAAPLMKKAKVLADLWSSGKINVQDYWLQAQQLQNGIDAINIRIREAQDKVLSRKDNELINLSNASTSYPNDELMIRQFISGTEEQICSMVANLLRKHIRASRK